MVELKCLTAKKETDSTTDDARCSKLIYIRALALCESENYFELASNLHLHSINRYLTAAQVTRTRRGELFLR